MRTREEIEAAGRRAGWENQLIIELLLDIRERLERSGLGEDWKTGPSRESADTRDMKCDRLGCSQPAAAGSQFCAHHKGMSSVSG